MVYPKRLWLTWSCLFLWAHLQPYVWPSAFMLLTLFLLAMFFPWCLTWLHLLILQSLLKYPFLKACFLIHPLLSVVFYISATFSSYHYLKSFPQYMCLLAYYHLSFSLECKFHDDRDMACLIHHFDSLSDILKLLLIINIHVFINEARAGSI